MFDFVHESVTWLVVSKCPVFLIIFFFFVIELIWILVPSSALVLLLIKAEMLKKTISEPEFA